MKIVCISAANVIGARQHSASVQACQIIADLMKIERPDAEVEIVPMLDYEMKPCTMCGECLQTQRCSEDEAYNQIFEKILAADGVFVVIPHYAPFPSKVMILLEKLEEMTFLGFSNDEKNFRAPISGKPLGVIGHGGQITAEALDYYQKALVEPLAMAFMSCGFKVINAGDKQPYGISFGIQSLHKPEGSIFVKIEHDWPAIQQRIQPLVKNLAAVLTV
jgi:multimeric flavodoxin WrbA